MHELPEHKESLWWLAISPAIWVAYLLACYITVAIWCAKFVTFAGSLEGVRCVVYVYTAVALAGVLATGWRSWRRHRLGSESWRHGDTPEDRHRFLGFAAFLLSLLSALGVAYVALPILFIGTCR